jgi:hypothetical protein
MKTFLLTLPLVALTLALPATPASAQDPAAASIGHRHHHYDVYYRHGHHHSHWELYGSFPCREEADHAAHHLEHRGLRTKVERD